MCHLHIYKLSSSSHLVPQIWQKQIQQYPAYSCISDVYKDFFSQIVCIV